MIKDGFCFCSLSVRFRGYSGLHFILRIVYIWINFSHRSLLLMSSLLADWDPDNARGQT